MAPPRLAVAVPGSKGAGRGCLRLIGTHFLIGALLLMFFAISAAIFLFGLAGTTGPWKAGMSDNAPPQTYLGMMAFGTVFFLVTLRIAQVALVGEANEARPRNRGKGGGQPWTWDHPWKQEGMHPDYTGSPGGTLLGRVALLGLIGLFNLALGSPAWEVKAVVVLFDLFGLLLLVDSLGKIWQWLRFRQPTVDWKTFPAFLGGPLATVRFPRAIRPAGAAVATLRCVQDEEVARGRDVEGEPLGPELRPFSRYTQTREIPLPDGPLDRLDLAFHVPADLPGTQLGVPEATYWQVLLTIPTPGPDFETVFLAPVYRRL